MSKKPKEQVKYNPSLSGPSRVEKCVRAIQGKEIIACAICYTLFFLMGVVGLVITSLTEITKTIEDPSGLGASIYMVFFFALVSTSFFAVTPTARRDEQNQRSVLGGCGSISELFMHLPVKKVDLYKHSFRYYLVSLTTQSVVTIFLNVLILVKDEYEAISSYISVVSIYLTLFTVLLYILFFDLRPKSTGDGKFHSTTAIVVLMSAFGIGAALMLGSNFILKLQGSFICGYAGIPAIVVSVLAVIFVTVAEKAIIEKRAVGTAWYE